MSDYKNQSKNESSQNCPKSETKNAVTDKGVAGKPAGFRSPGADTKKAKNYSVRSEAKNNASDEKC